MVIWIEKWFTKVIVSLAEKPCSIHNEVTQIVAAHCHCAFFCSLRKRACMSVCWKDTATRRREPLS